MKKFILIILVIINVTINAHAQNKLKSNVRVNGLYITSLDLALDSIGNKYHVHFVFDREVISHLDLVAHYFNEPLKNVLTQICTKNELHYWVDNDQTIYIIQNPQDVDRLKRLQANMPDITQPKTGPTNTHEPEKLSEQVKIKPISTHFNISGRVIDQSTGESLPTSVVKVQSTNITATTNVDGYFTIFNVPADTCKLDVTFMGYRADTYQLNTDNIKGNITIGLFASKKTLDEVIISDKRAETAFNTDNRRVSTIQLSPEKLDELPNIGEKDILRAFQLVPGVSGTNESSSGLYVRGGTPDQNLVLFDGFTVYQVDHLYGFFSAFNSNAVKDVTLYKGGFSAKYGGRLSSVTDIVGKDGNKKEPDFGVDLSLLSANAYAELPIGDKSTLLLAYRHSYQGPLYNKIFDKFNSTSFSGGGGGGIAGGPPGGGGGGFRGGGGGFGNVTVPTSYFYDLNAKYTYTPNQKDLFSWSLYQGNDYLDNSRSITLPSGSLPLGGGFATTDKTTYGNLGSSFKWSRQWNSKIYSNTLLSYSTFHNNRTISNQITTLDSLGNATTANNGTFETNTVKDLSLKSDWEWQVQNNAKLLYGAFATRQDIAYKYAQNDTSTLINQDRTAMTGGVYVELEDNPTDKLQIKPGLRATYYNQTSKFYLEPRLSGTYSLTDRLTLKAATGRFDQFTDKIVREDVLSGNQDFWALANGSTIPVSTANHFIGGFSYETKQFLVDVEGYYKQMDGLTEYSQRETGNRSQIQLEQHFYNGSEDAHGIEFLLQKTHGDYTGWISYTLSQATNNFAVFGGEFPSNQDVRNEFKTVHVYRYKRWAFSASWIFATGHPYTAPLSSYTINNFSGNNRNFLTVSSENGERLPDYSRLDAAITYDLIKLDSRKIGSIGFSFFNIYNRANVWYKEYTIVNNQVFTTDVDYLGFTPNITLSLRWK